MGARKKPPMAIYVLANEVAGEVINSWLLDFDPDGKSGRGTVEFTDDRDKALGFETIEELHAFWTQQSTLRPTRSDGKPNRPLTAFTIEARPVERHTGMRWGKHRMRGSKNGR